MLSDSDDLEVVTGFDDLNLEIVSEKAESSSALKDTQKDTQKKNSPSIDDFVISKQEPAQTRKSKNTDQWFLNVLGQEMGPFPFDVLVNMVVDEEVGPKDQIRNGSEGEWMIAGEIAGLFPEVEGDFELEGAEFQGTSNQPADESPGVQIVGGNDNRAAMNAKPKKKPAPAKPNFQPIPEINADPPEIEVPEPIQVPQTESAPAAISPEEIEAKRKQDIADRLNSWLGDEVEPEPEVEPEDENKQNSTSTPNPVASTPVAPVPRPTYTPPKIKKVKQPREKIDFSGLTNLLNPKLFIGIGVVVLIVGFMYLPGLLGGTNDVKTNDRIKEIYSQVQRARQNPSLFDKMGKEIIPELEKMATALEDAGAGAQKPIKQKQLFCARYCLIPIIQGKFKEPNKKDEKYESYQKEISILMQKN